MSRCIVHVGMHKTGSTSIQHSLKGFADESFLYATLGGGPNHSLAISSLFAMHPERHRLHIANNRTPTDLREYISRVKADLEQSVSESKDRTLLISGEGILGLKRAELASLRDYFRARFDELSILAYVRAPASFMASAFQEQVRAGPIKQFNVGQAYPSYEASFGKFDDIFGRANVSLWKFDPQRFPSGCVVRDFCFRLGLAVPPKRIVRMNESLSRQLVSLIYIWHKMCSKVGFVTGAETVRLAKALAGIGSDKFRFSPNLVKPLLETKQADIEWMESRLGESLQEEVSDYQAGDVRDEADLLNPGPEIASALRRLLGEAAPADVAGETPMEIAKLMQLMHARLMHRREKRNMNNPGLLA